MTRNPKITILCILCIFICGLLVSYKSFEIQKNAALESRQESNRQVSAWVAESVEQKLTQLESSVSYLDKSTVESLKRFGARYFAYAHKKQGEWSIKWKVLNDQFGKEQILSEVNQIKFDLVAADQRTWGFSENDKMIYIAPVSLAKSHQLKSGFLVFGLNPSFFNFLKEADESVVLLDKNNRPVHGTIAHKIEEDFFDTEKMSVGQQVVYGLGEQKLMTSFFSSQAQLWIVGSSIMATASFFESPLLSYALIGSLLGALLFLVLMTRLEERTSVEAASERKSLLDGLSFKKPIWMNSLSMPSFLENSKAEKSVQTGEKEVSITEEVVPDFSNFLDEILHDDFERLSKVGISIQTQVEEGIQLVCTPKHVADLLKRLIGNSVIALEKAPTKEIQIQLVEQSDSYQLIYLDTRENQFPSQAETSLLLQTEGSLTGIDGILSYAAWLFGERLTVAKKGFCLSIDMKKVTEKATDQEIEQQIQALDVLPLTETLQRIEIPEEETDESLLSHFQTIAADKVSPELQATSERVLNNLEELNQEAPLEDVIENFELKEFHFSGTQEALADSMNEEEPSLESLEVATDDKGLFEFDTGQFKIKIRSPKKRDMDVDS